MLVLKAMMMMRVVEVLVVKIVDGGLYPIFPFHFYFSFLFLFLLIFYF